MLIFHKPRSRRKSIDPPVRWFGWINGLRFCSLSFLTAKFFLEIESYDPGKIFWGKKNLIGNKGVLQTQAFLENIPTFSSFSFLFLRHSWWCCYREIVTTTVYWIFRFQIFWEVVATHTFGFSCPRFWKFLSTLEQCPPMNSFQFTAPLVRFATGGQPVASDIQQLIESIPNFVVNVPGLGNVDISKVFLPWLLAFATRLI